MLSCGYENIPLPLLSKETGEMSGKKIDLTLENVRIEKIAAEGKGLAHV